MKIILNFILLLTSSLIAVCQQNNKTFHPIIDWDKNDSSLYFLTINDSASSNNTVRPYIDDRELFLNFPGGFKAQSKFLKKNFHVPDSLFNKKIEGTVIVIFLLMNKARF
jgi:hypothetical protein